MKKILLSCTVYSLVILSLLFIIFINLGKFFDVSQIPQKSDVIVCLGGGSGERIQKSLEYYLQGYSRSQKIILTGSKKVYIGQKLCNKIHYLIEHGVLRENIIFLEATSNTMKEVWALQKYLRQHHLKSVMFISDPPHSRRIMFLADKIAGYQHDGLTACVVSSKPQWWNAKHYYNNKQALIYVAAEMLKLPTNYIAYGILKPLGLYDPIVQYLGTFLYSIKHHIQKILR